MANVILLAPAGLVVQGYPVAADGTIAVPAQLVLQFLAMGCQYILSSCDIIFLQAPAAPDLVSIVAAVAPVSGTPFLIATHPDVPRKLRVNIVQSGAVANLVVNLVGIDGRGNAVSETVNVAGASSQTLTTVNAYAKLTSATPVGTVTNVTTIGIGVSSALALITSPTFLGADLFVYKESMASAGTGTFADEAVGTVDPVAGTITPTTAPNGTRSFKFWTGWSTAA